MTSTSKNYFYHEPLNSSIDEDYFYIYVYKDPAHHYIPDTIVFFLFAVLIINTITAIPANLFVLISIWKDKDLRTNKFAFLSIVTAGDLVNALTNNIVSLAALRHGLILKSACKVGAVFNLTSLLLRMGGIGCLGSLAIIRSRTLMRENTQHIQKLFTKICIAAMITVVVFFGCVGSSGLVGTFFTWDGNVFSCAARPNTLILLVQRFGDHNALTRLFTFVMVPYGLSIFIQTIVVTVYLTYEKIRFYVCLKPKISPSNLSAGAGSSHRVETRRGSLLDGSGALTTNMVFLQEEKASSIYSNTSHNFSSLVFC